MDANRVGRWAALFGGRRSFQKEIERAVEIGAHWSKRAGQRDIVVDEIAGWLPPMWGSDEHWLYLRRPEGVWKTRRPQSFEGTTPIVLHQKRPGAAGGQGVAGGMVLGASISNQSGWIRGAQTTSPMDAAERDEKALPANRGFDVDADAVDQTWGKHIASEPGRLVVDAGDHFNTVPVFELQREWLMATDAKTGHRVAFQISSEARRRHIGRGELWMLFANRWFDGLEVRVVIEETSAGLIQSATT